MEQDLTTDLCVLQRHLDGMLDRVQQNSLTLKRLQSFEMRMLGVNSLVELIEFILEESKTLFDLDIVSLTLLDPKNEVADYLSGDHYRYATRPGLLLLKDEQIFKTLFMFSGRPLLGAYQPASHQCFFASLPSPPASVVLAPVIRRGRFLGSVNFGSLKPERFLHSMGTDFIEHLASVIGVCLENILNFETMRRTSLVDPLTGVNNRRFLEQRIEEELDRSVRNREALSCLFLDIDFFKRINDGHGHQAGDHVLVTVAGSIKKQLRSNDVLARYGGEEFVALLSQSDENISADVAERIRATVERLRITVDERGIPATLSIGIATFKPEQSSGRKAAAELAKELIQAADEALYRAKNNGRNRVENHGLIDDAAAAVTVAVQS
ncbi:MAG: sensor domain-containing diguanylate cyclase [Methylomonas sp.]|nr:sensor domain-containing diguanylate cyclase [Methylomonas sp.]